jgi:hypothetical protein
LDVVGYNYQEQYYEKDHNDYPQRCIIGGENSSELSAWEAVEKNDYVSGQFIWTGFDYLGEADAWPNKSWSRGLFDLCGFKKPQAWFRQSIWTTEPMVYLACQETAAGRRRPSSLGWQQLRSQWNWPEGKQISVFCCTNCDEAELFLNGTSLGSKSGNKAKERTLIWDIPFTAGSLKAVGKRNSRVVCEYVLHTVGQPAQIKLFADTKQLIADGKDISHIEFCVVDAKGIVVPDAQVLVTFDVNGPARIIGLGNSNPNSHESHRGDSHSTWRGRGLLILQSTKLPGTVSLKANAQALESDSITINTK